MTTTPTPRLSPWRMVVGLGSVSLFADMVADGGKSLYGPLLGAVGASALVVGVVTGLAEATSLILRLLTGSLADRKGNHWSWTIAGYGLTALCIPLLAITPHIGAVGVVVASLLIIAERVGKAVRSPAKSALLAHAAKGVGRGKGFGVHKALDLIGAVSGPLVVAAILAATGRLWLAYAVLAIPALATMLLLLVLRHRVPDPSIYDDSPVPAQAQQKFWDQVIGQDLPREFFIYATAVALMTGGIVAWGIVGYHLEQQGILPLAVIPLVFAGAMAMGAIAALINGRNYDRVGARVLYVVPVLTGAVPALALGNNLWLALAGMACWGFANGIQDSTIKAVVADLVPQQRLASAYGVFAAIQGLAALVGGLLIGWLYDTSILALIVVVVVLQLAALALLALTNRRRPR